MITIHFDRIGRTYDVPDLTIDPAILDHRDAEPAILSSVRSHARKYLMSRDVSGAVSDNLGVVYIYAGMNNGGVGRIDYGDLIAWWDTAGHIRLDGRTTP